jgi:type II secretory pathway component PulL
LNLLQGAFQPRHHHVDWREMARRGAWGLALLAGIHVLGTSLDWLLLVRERQEVQAEMQDLAARALPAHAAIVDPAWQVGERLRALQAAHGEGDGGPLGLLGQVGQAWPEGVAPPRVVDYREHNLTLTLAAPPGDWLAGFQSRLAALGLQAAFNDNALAIRAGREETHGR